MTQHIIKQVDSETICLDDSGTSRKIGLKTLLMVGLLYLPMIISTAYFFLTLNDINVNSLDIFVVITALTTAATAVCILFHDIVFDYKPAYCVYIEGHYDTSITIPKINNKIDQDEICKATNRLVSIAQEFVDHRNKIEKIVEKCR